MPDRATYIHGTATSEQHRLVALNRLTNGPFVEYLGVRPGDLVLEVGSGLGILAAAVADTAPGVRVVGLELSAAQLASARRHRAVTFVRADGQAVPAADRSFDLVYVRYLLEHVADPGLVVAEARRVLRAGGRIAVMENDVSLIRFDPPCPAFASVWASFADLQRRLGGDALIGRRLHRLLHDAGFRDIELSVQPEVHWHGSPDWVSWVNNIIGNVESARANLVGLGLCADAAVDAGVAELRRLMDDPTGSSLWIWSRARGIRPEGNVTPASKL